LFERVAPEGSVFTQMIDKYFKGQRDGATLRFLGVA